MNIRFLSFPITFKSIQEEIQSKKTERNEKRKIKWSHLLSMGIFIRVSPSDDQGQD